MTPLDIFHCDVSLDWAGGQNQLLELARELRRRGHRQWIVTRPESALATRAGDEGFEILEHPCSGDIDPRGVFSLTRLVRRYRPRIVHAHDAHTLTPAAIAARLTRPRPVVVGHRRVGFHIQRHVFSKWKYTRGPDRIVAVSRHVRDVLVEDGVDARGVAVVHDGVRIETPPTPPGPGLRRRIDADDRSALVVTIASASAYKDHPTLVNAASHLADRSPATQWVVLGGGDALEEYRARVVELGLAERLHYLGFVDRAREFLPQADVFVLSSRTEGLGSSVLDAMAAGVPIVSTAAGGVSEMIEHGVTGLLTPIGDGAALAAAVDRVLDSPRLGARLATAARERVRNFAIERMVDQTERLYRELVG